MEERQKKKKTSRESKKESPKAVKIKPAKWLDYINKPKKLRAKHSERKEIEAQRDERGADERKEVRGVGKFILGFRIKTAKWSQLSKQTKQIWVGHQLIQRELRD